MKTEKYTKCGTTTLQNVISEARLFLYQEDWFNIGHHIENTKMEELKITFLFMVYFMNLMLKIAKLSFWKTTRVKTVKN